MRIDELPPIDVIVLSPMHGDHWDRVSQKGLDHDLPVLTTMLEFVADDGSPPPPAARGFRSG